MRYIGEIIGEDRRLNFNFEEKRKAFIDVYNYLGELSNLDEFWDMLECDADTLEEYGELIESINLKMGGLMFDMQRASSSLVDTELVSKRHTVDWYSNKGLRELIVNQIKFISKNTYFKLYNDKYENIDRLYIKEIKDV